QPHFHGAVVEDVLVNLLVAGLQLQRFGHHAHNDVVEIRLLRIALEGIDRRAGPGDEVLPALLIVHGHDGGEVLNRDSGVLEAALVAAAHVLAALFVADAAGILIIAVGIAAPVDQPNEGRAVDARVPLTLDRHAVTARQLVANLHRLLPAGLALDFDG